MLFFIKEGFNLYFMTNKLLDLRQSANLLYNIILKNEKRMQTGIAERNRLKKQIAQNQRPSGYRADFLRDSAKRVINLLNECGRDFNRYLCPR
jgi:hypothetical protein